MPKYKPVAELIAEQLFAAKNRMFDFVQQRLDEGKAEKEIMKELKETVTADPLMLAEIEHVFFSKKAATWIDDAKVGDQVSLNDEVGEVTHISNAKIEVKTPTKTETIWKN